MPFAMEVFKELARMYFVPWNISKQGKTELMKYIRFRRVEMTAPNS